MVNIGSNRSENVTCPLVFENRYFLVDQSTGDVQWTVLSLQDGDLIVEVLNNKPQKNKITEVVTNPTGIITVSDKNSDKFLYKIRPDSKSTSIFGSIRGEETEIKITDKEIRVGTNVFQNNCIMNSPIGIMVDKDGGIALGGGKLPQKIYEFLYSPDMKFNDRKFENENVAVDNNSYDKCTFIKCTLVYSGGKPPAITNCEFRESRWSFSNQAANTIQFMKAMYQGGFKQLIEETFVNIKTRTTN